MGGREVKGCHAEKLIFFTDKQLSKFRCKISIRLGNNQSHDQSAAMHSVRLSTTICGRRRAILDNPISQGDSSLCQTVMAV